MWKILFVVGLGRVDFHAFSPDEHLIESPEAVYLVHNVFLIGLAEPPEAV